MVRADRPGIIFIDLTVPEVDVGRLIAIAETAMAGVASPYTRWVPAAPTPTTPLPTRRRPTRDRAHLEVLEGGLSASG